MHLAEGIVTSPLVLGGGALVAAGGVALGLRKLDEVHALRTAVLGSGFFVASLIHIPFVGVSIHLTLAGLLGIILGWAAFPAVLVGLILQLILFGFGGLTTLGLNTCVMAIPAVGAYYASRGALRSDMTSVATWLCGFIAAGAVACSALLLASILALADEAFHNVFWAVLLAHVPVMALEAGVTAAAVGFLARVSPELLSSDALVLTDPIEEESLSCD